MLKRTLWHQEKDERKTLSQDELTKKTNPLIIVGEAGMGKSCLLKWLGSLENYCYCTARQLINRANLHSLIDNNRILVIDALDEISSSNDGDRVDRILQKLEILDYPKFILACRVADWRSATGIETIREQYNEEPLELHLNPFTQQDMSEFLKERFNEQKAQDIIDHFTVRGLDDLLGNPQTLNLIAQVATTNALPETVTQLFEQATELLRVEHSDSKAKAQLPSETEIDTAGAAFASLILTGNEAITRKAITNTVEGELPISEIKLLPDTANIDTLLGSRLFQSNGVEKFTYLHRRIGEFLGAKWLIKQANTNRKRQRLLALFHSYEFVPPSLRGLHAWLIMDPIMAPDIISNDPMGILEYGDVDNLTIEQAKILLNNIEYLADNNPRFYNFYNKDTYNIHVFTTPALLNQIKNILSQSKISFGFRVFLLDAIKTSQLPIDFIKILKGLVKNPKIEFAIRKSAGEALAIQKQHINWDCIFPYLAKLDDESIRLAIELLDDTGYDKANNELIANLAISHLESSEHVIGPLFYLQENLPKEQIEHVLHFFIVGIKVSNKDGDSEAKNEAKNFAYRLILRFLENYEISAEKLWSWLEPFHDIFGYHDEYIKKLEDFFRKNQELRQAIQYFVLFKQPCETNIWHKHYLLQNCSKGLSIIPKDIIALLKRLYIENQNDLRWKELVELTYHDKEIGKDVREAAIPFTVNDRNANNWLNQIAIRKLTDGEIKDLELKKRKEEQRATSLAAQRSIYIENIERLRQGEYEVILKPAKVYLQLFSDISKDTPAHQRISEWVGNDISEVCIEGFEAFLGKNSSEISTPDISTFSSQSKSYQKSYILIAALAERIRTNKGFSDLSNDCLVSAYHALLRMRYDTHAGIPDILEIIENEIRQRGILLKSIQAFYEPQLQAKYEHIYGLKRLTSKNEDIHIIIKLVNYWLKIFTEIPINVETELIDILLQNKQFDTLRQLTPIRMQVDNDEQKRNWLVIGLITDFEKTIKAIGSQPIDPNLIWNLRDRINNRYMNNKLYKLLDIDLLEWIISTFRTFWPNIGHPNGVSGGNTNPWDASDFIIGLIQYLAQDSSEQAYKALERLRDSSIDGYRDIIKLVLFEKKQIHSESLYSPPSMQAIKAITNDLSPQSIADLQVFILDELNTVQAKIKSDDAESWRGFFDDNGKPYVEERCRDHLLGLLRQGDSRITYEPEKHAANDKEVDITCSVGQLRLPIEVKGQWHPDLWTGADDQLNKLYAQDWQAKGRGIYLVLWFGLRIDNKKLKRPSKGKPIPKTPQELEDLLISNSRSAQEGNIKIVILDIDKIHLK